MEFQLTKQQQQIFDTVENSDTNYLIHGKPGVGKSVLINALMENGQKHYTLAAPTGLAALNIGGRTLHSIFRIPVSGGIFDPTFNNFTSDENTLKYIGNGIKALIIDEVSMVRADTFDYIDRLMKHAKQNDLLFGGIQLIIVGDFYQLPPVVVREEATMLKTAGYNSPFVFSSKAFSGFTALILDEVLRQKGDPDFIDILHSARTGSVADKQIDVLNKQVANSADLRIKLTATNSIAEAINRDELNKLEQPTVCFKAEKYGYWPATPTDELLNLRVGAQVIIKANGADRPPNHTGAFTSKVVNGTLGKIKEINEAQQKVMVELPNNEVVTIYRKRSERKQKEKSADGKWHEKVIATYDQLPVALAWAISIHKSQGQSFDKVHIDANKIFAPGQLYVALSRARTLNGISFTSPLKAKQFWANKDVLKFFTSVKS